MKTVLAIIAVIVIGIGAGYFGVPILIEKETGQLKADVQDMKQRLQVIDEFVKSEEEARKVTQLSPDADLQKVIKVMNSFSTKVTTFENSLKNDITQTNNEMKQQKQAQEDSLKKQAEKIDKLDNETKGLKQKTIFDATMANIRVHLLKARTDLFYKNIGTAKTEFSLISDTFEKVKGSASDENKKIIEEYQRILKAAQSEVDSDLPAAMNKVDLLWHEMGKLLRKS